MTSVADLLDLAARIGRQELDDDRQLTILAEAAEKRRRDLLEATETRLHELLSMIGALTPALRAMSDAEPPETGRS